MSVYFDTSFLVSLYAFDTNSPIAARTMPTGEAELWIIAFTRLEVVNAFSLCVFRKELTPTLAHASHQVFQQDIRNGVLQVKPLSSEIFDRAGALSRATTPRLGTRAGDLLHVAAALELGADEFYTFDRQQGKLAKEMKLRINSMS